MHDALRYASEPQKAVDKIMEQYEEQLRHVTVHRCVAAFFCSVAWCGVLWRGVFYCDVFFVSRCGVFFSLLFAHAHKYNLEA